MSAQSNIAKLPERCYLVNKRDGAFCTDAPVICIMAGESGFYPVRSNNPAAFVECKPEDYTRQQNEFYGVQPWHIEAMRIGSMMGWEVPGADADTWRDHFAKRGAQGVQS